MMFPHVILIVRGRLVVNIDGYENVRKIQHTICSGDEIDEFLGLGGWLVNDSTVVSVLPTSTFLVVLLRTQ